ncbi:hypothetical protein BC835DRAFT_1305558 [Cytidiella melzeri]|nr:hypothetical protein BC835DRAFT_1305558 [Cytidiella melzeri]
MEPLKLLIRLTVNVRWVLALRTLHATSAHPAASKKKQHQQNKSRYENDKQVREKHTESRSWVMEPSKLLIRLTVNVHWVLALRTLHATSAHPAASKKKQHQQNKSRYENDKQRTSEQRKASVEQTVVQHGEHKGKSDRRVREKHTESRSWVMSPQNCLIGLPSESIGTTVLTLRTLLATSAHPAASKNKQLQQNKSRYENDKQVQEKHIQEQELGHGALKTAHSAYH